jgi:protein SCO1
LQDWVIPMMISIDPYRDTPEQLKRYVKEFHPRFVGLTGTRDEIKQVARDFRIYNVIPETDSGDYLVDHSVFTFLMSPKGEFLDFFGPDKDEIVVTRQIEKRIREYEEIINPPNVFTRAYRYCVRALGNAKE